MIYLLFINVSNFTDEGEYPWRFINFFSRFQSEIRHQCLLYTTDLS